MYRINLALFYVGAGIWAARYQETLPCNTDSSHASGSTLMVRIINGSLPQKYIVLNQQPA